MSYSYRGYGASSRYRSTNPDTTAGKRITTVDPYWMLMEHNVNERDRDVLGHRGADDLLPGDEVYQDKLNRIVSAAPCIGVPPRPSLIMPGLYLGTQANAENMECLKHNKITHVLNCAGLPTSLRRSRASRYDQTDVMYDEIAADDDDDYPIKNHFSQAHTFIDRGRLSGRVLVHCTGVSRSGAVVISYLVRSGRRLLDAASVVKKERRCVLCNTGFEKQLVEHARHHGMLDPEPDHYTAPRYGGVIDRQRIRSAHLPTFL